MAFAAARRTTMLDHADNPAATVCVSDWLSSCRDCSSSTASDSSGFLVRKLYGEITMVNKQCVGDRGIEPQPDAPHAPILPLN